MGGVLFISSAETDIGAFKDALGGVRFAASNRELNALLAENDFGFVVFSREKFGELSENIKKIYAENDKLNKKIDDIKIVERAKNLLTQYLRLTEAEAHKHIERRAMDTRRAKVEVARDIIRTYENL